jgi:2-polyprenyl-3-methyl-5-hydroxy-6-metoxy-1,4-benzoquinol methylase
MPEYRLHQHPDSSHQRIAGLLRAWRRSPILDVGAARGFLAELLHDTALTLDGIEAHAAWAEAARPLYREMFACPVEAAALPDRAYAVVVCADVLEHTVNPVAVLDRLRRAAAEDAVFVVSLPNVAHLAVRLLLLAGRFPRMDRGILDRTHLHFYTRDTAEEMLREAGLAVEQVLTTTVPLEVLWPRRGLLCRMLMAVQRGAVRVAPRLFAFQWVFVATPLRSRAAAA